MAFSLKMRRSRASVIPALYGYRAVGHFHSAEYARGFLKSKWLSVRQPDAIILAIGPVAPYTRRVMSCGR